MVRKFTQHQNVESDIEQIFEFLSEHNVEAAQSVVEAIYKTLENISQNPEHFSQVYFSKLEAFKIRRAIALPYQNYLIFFVQYPDEIRILYVHHASRDLEDRFRSEIRI